MTWLSRSGKQPSSNYVTLSEVAKDMGHEASAILSSVHSARMEKGLMLFDIKITDGDAASKRDVFRSILTEWAKKNDMQIGRFNAESAKDGMLNYATSFDGPVMEPLEEKAWLEKHADLSANIVSDFAGVQAKSKGMDLPA